MNRLRTAVVALLCVGATLPTQATAAAAVVPDATPAQQLATLNQQLTSEQDRLNTLNNQVEQAQSTLDGLSRKLNDDHQRETSLNKQLVALGRLEYEQPAFSLSTILDARSLDQLLSNMAQAQLVAHKQRNLLDQTRRLRQQDQQAHDQMSTQLTGVQAARDEAAQVAARTLALRSSAQDAALRARADALNAQARATQTIARPPSGAWPNHFAFGYCTYYVATRRYVPWFGNAIQWYANAAAYGYPEGKAPRVTAIMVTAESGFGHVAYVEAVYPDGSWMVSEMNFIGWNVVSRRTIRPGQVPLLGFIYGQ